MLSENLKRIRKERELSRRKLSKLSGITITNIQDIEEGNNTNPTLNTLLALSKSLKVAVSTLIK